MSGGLCRLAEWKVPGGADSIDPLAFASGSETGGDTMSDKSVLFHIDGDSRVATLTLNRPDKLNSFTRAMHGEMSHALTEIEASNARALVITGAGRGFCAGQDLADLDFTPDSMTDLG